MKGKLGIVEIRQEGAWHRMFQNTAIYNILFNLSLHAGLKNTARSYTQPSTSRLAGESCGDYFEPKVYHTVQIFNLRNGPFLSN